MGRVFDADDRPDDSLAGLTQLCNDWIGPDFVMAEIGVYRGAATTLFSSYARTVYAIDSWVSNPDYTELGKDLLEGAEIQFDMMMASHLNIVKVRGLSSVSSELFLPGYLDMIYIDGDHSEKAFKLDMKCWVPKVKPGGVIAGHDFNMVGEWIEFRGDISHYPDNSWAYEKP